MRPVAVQALYRDLGYQPIGLRCRLPPDMVDGLVFLELQLSSEASSSEASS